MTIEVRANICDFIHDLTTFKAGKLRDFLPCWRKITSDSNILNYVCGVKIAFEENLVPVQTHYRPSVFNCHDEQIVQKEITTLLSKGVIQYSSHEQGEFISTIFLRPKPDGSFRMILNLKQFNQSVEYHHFKMDTLETVVKLVKPGCYMASVDLKDAYYTVPIHPDHQKFLKFEFKGQLYKYACLPNGLSSAPRIFTKMLKPVYTTLHNQGYISVGYIDDSYLQGDTISECRKNILCTAKLFTELGFYVHPIKSVSAPTQKLVFLGFIIDSINMIVLPTPEKIEKTVKACGHLLRKKTINILDVASVIGRIISLFPGAEYGPLHYRILEREKTIALKNNSGNFNAAMKLSDASINELRWWIVHAQNAKRCIYYPAPTSLIQSDASKKGWGAVLNGKKIGGRWTPSEACRHINILELQAALFGLKSFADNYKQTHIQLQLDNTTAVAYINNMGGSKSPELDKLAKELWEWAIFRKIWVSAVHIPGIANTDADEQSRNFHDKHEWCLSNVVFQDITKEYPNLNIDLFATRLNNKLDTYCSWKPDPGCEFVDAFSVSWTNYNFYAFPPFSLIPRCLQKIRKDRTQGILIVPLWPSQPWFPLLLQQLYRHPWIVGPHKKMIQHIAYQEPHPLWQKLKLMVCPVSGIHSQNTTFLATLQTSSWPPGELALRNNIKHTSRNGSTFVVKDKLIVIPHRLVKF